MSRRTLIALGAAAAAAALVVALLVWQPWSQAPEAAPLPGEEPEVEVVAPEIPDSEPIPFEGPTTVLTLHQPTEVHLGPGTGPVSHELPRWTYYGLDQTLVVLDTREVDGRDWHLVDLPMKPHGQRGWVSPDDASLTTVTTRAQVDLDARTVTLWDGDNEIAIFPVAIGTDATPTPLGVFYVTDPLDLTLNPTGVYGAYAIGLSGYSEVLDQFDGAPPQIALHGTNRPELIGDAVSNGCIRLSNEDVLVLAEHLVPGSPVSVVASQA